MQRRTTVALLTVIAVLLALNLVVKGSRKVEAQGIDADGPPSVANIAADPSDHRRFLRFWSDGQVDRTRVTDFGGCGYDPFAEVIFGPSGHSSPLKSGSFANGGYYLHYEDDRVDFRIEGQEHFCTVFGEGGGFGCFGDIDRDGRIDIRDLIGVLSAWGTCSE